VVFLCNSIKFIFTDILTNEEYDSYRPLFADKTFDILFKIPYDLIRILLNFWKFGRTGIGKQVDEGKRGCCIPSD